MDFPTPEKDKFVIIVVKINTVSFVFFILIHCYTMLYFVSKNETLES